MTARTRLFVLLVSAPVFAFAVIGGFLGKVVAREDTYQHLRVFEDVLSLITSNYVEEVNVDRVMHGAMHGLADALDPDSAYLTPNEVRDVEKGVPLPAGDLGIDLTRQYYLRIIGVRDDSPAAKAGLRSGDYVRVIDHQPTRDMSVWEGSRLLRGEPGSKVSLTLIRGNAADPHVVDLVREKLPPLTPTTRMLTEGVGYLRVAEFEPGTAGQIDRDAAALAREGATRLVVDLRNTVRGPLDAGLAAARLFVPGGTLVGLETRNERRQTVDAQAGDGKISMPAAILVNNGTAGAAELFAAALSGNKRASLVGERTAGRAGVQKLVKLQDGSGLWLTRSWYLTPVGNQIQDKGLAPDVEVEEPDVEFGAPAPTTDIILQKAIEHLAGTARANG